MDIFQYIKAQPIERQILLSKIHEVIIENDKTINAEVELMMGKDMIVYKGRGLMKYGLSSVKNHMSLHAMPIYGSATLHNRYKTLLNNTIFQKGCINFKKESDLPLEIVKELILDCSIIDLFKLKEDFMKSKKSAKK